ncbi:unnamed protein product [Blepharisma stoltei]|uniref:O-methyltransferase n=1 Tax=Blepharisma stoltei TaxID=1481888 RepID=A0AAU9I911_9CILI|nr:unnamed protein product [Blepharisma stoltei]
MEGDKLANFGKFYQLFVAPQVTIMLYTVVELDIPRLLIEPKTFSQLAEQTPAIPEKLERILFALEPLGFFSFNQETGLWSNSPMSETLLDEKINAMARWLGNPFELDMLTKFPESVRQHISAAELRFGCHPFEYLAAHPDLLETFQSTMREFTKIFGDGFKIVDLSSANRVLDVGGGDGSLLIELLKWNPHISGAVYELEAVKSKAEKNFTDHNLQEKFSVISGSFLNSVPEGFDCIVMKHILHDWDDENSKKILQNCRRALEAGKQLKIIDNVIIRSSDHYLYSRMADIHMMAMLNGKERSKEQLEALLNETGFRLDSVDQIKPIQDFVVSATAI